MKTGTKWTAEQRALQSARQLGKKRGSYKNKKGPLSDAQKQRIVASWTPERRAAARARVLGTTHECSEQTRERISSALKRRFNERGGWGAFEKGRERSAAHCAALSEAQRRVQATKREARSLR